jgi:NADPH:quinone reductase-like Zn-dependent oxidoreductase
MAAVDKPAPKADEVLVKVLALSVNPADWHCLHGKPLFSRATLGLLRRKHQLLGGDIAGQVEAVGSGVTRFKPGDEVYGNLLDHGNGGFAEFVSVPVDVMSVKRATCRSKKRPRFRWARHRTSGPFARARQQGARSFTVAPQTWAQRLTDQGVTYTEQRVVRAEKVLTSAGASARDRPIGELVGS